MTHLQRGIFDARQRSESEYNVHKADVYINLFTYGLIGEKAFSAVSSEAYQNKIAFHRISMHGEPTRSMKAAIEHLLTRHTKRFTDTC